MAKSVKRTKPSTPKRDGMRRSRPKRASGKANPLPTKQTVSMGIRNRVGVPLAPDEQERRRFAHLVPVHKFLSKYPYDLHRISLGSKWEEILEVAARMDIPGQVQLFTLYSNALRAIADDTKDDHWRRYASRADEWVAKLSVAEPVAIKPM